MPHYCSPNAKVQSFFDIMFNKRIYFSFYYLFSVFM